MEACRLDSSSLPASEGAERTGASELRRSASWLDGPYRWAFLLCVYTGLRAGFSRWRCRFQSTRGLAAPVHNARIPIGDSGSLRVAVHVRATPLAARATTRFGMFSCRQDLPALNRWLSRYLCLTSHFGCGHLEIAFYDDGAQLTIFAVRNTARSNAQRLGWRRIAKRLRSERSDLRAVRALINELECAGTSVRLAPATQCVALALNPRLVPRPSLAKTRAALGRKYRRLPRALGMTPPQPVHPRAFRALAHRDSTPTRARPRLPLTFVAR